MAHDDIRLQAERNKQKAETLLALANQAQRHLYAAQQRLGSARNWGIADILGGGFIVNMIKHSRLDDATRHIRQAQPLLKELGRALKQVAVDADMDLQLGGLAKFADFFFDGVFADVYVQSRIKDLQWQLDNTLGELERAKDALRQLHQHESERIARNQR